MAKKLKVDLAIQADGAYSCSSIKDYTDQFVVEQEVEYSAASNFQTISEFSKNKGALTVQNAKAIVIKNISNITAELLIKVQAYKNTSSVDVVNSDALGLTGARSLDIGVQYYQQVILYIYPIQDMLLMKKQQQIQ